MHQMNRNENVLKCGVQIKGALEKLQKLFDEAFSESSL